MSPRSPVAFVILAHSDPAMVRRLIGALEGADIFLHCDAHSRDDVARAMVPDGAAGVHPVPRRRTRLFDWSLVAAELDGLEMALRTTSAEHVAVLSGNCYPVVSLAEMSDNLAGWRGRSRFHLNPIPYHGWNTFWSRNGGLWRFNTRFLTVDDHLVTVRGRPIPLGRRPVPPELTLWGGSQWKVYARSHAQALLDALNRLPEQRPYWRGVFTPDESFVASILKSPAIVGDLTETVVDDYAWHILWSAKSAHPAWLTAEDYPELKQSRSAADKLFARKIKSSSTELLDRIDSELRS